jgi:adenine-specific DNA-methyltransferase
MAQRKKTTAGGKKAEKKLTRYTYDDIKEPRTPETGHTPLLPAEEQVVTLPMDNGWSKAIQVGKLPEGDERPVVVDMDPAADPVLFWAGKRNRREVPVLPLQRNEIVSESRIAQIIERARRAAEKKSGAARQGHLFADLEKTLRETDRKKRVEFYTHEEGWKNKLICGDSLHVMESLIHYENLRGKVQMIYIDPPYGIKYDSNFQQWVDSTENDDKDRADDVLTIKAFRDTWSLGVHSYLTYLQERLYLCRELLRDEGSVFVQISVENLHRVRALMDEVFGAKNYVAQIAFTKTTGLAADRGLASRTDFLVWYCRNASRVFQAQVYEEQDPIDSGFGYLQMKDGTVRALTADEKAKRRDVPEGSRFVKYGDLTKPGPGSRYAIRLEGKEFTPGHRWWGLPEDAMKRLIDRDRVVVLGKTLGQVRYYDDFPLKTITNLWTGFSGASRPVYVVQTNEEIVARCIHLTSRPGDLAQLPQLE